MTYNYEKIKYRLTELSRKLNEDAVSMAQLASNAKQNPDDEYYTSYDDTELLLSPFASFLKGKKVLMNCDDPGKSEMYLWMEEHMPQLGIVRLDVIGYGCQVLRRISPDGSFIEIPADNNGDFRTGTSLEALKECDVVVSNPPFSNNMNQDFFRLPLEHGKDVIGITWIGDIIYGRVAEAIKSKELVVYHCPYTKFNRPDNPVRKNNNKVQIVVLSTFKPVPDLKLKLVDKFNEAKNIGLRYMDLPEVPQNMKRKDANERRIDIRVLNLDGYSPTSTLMPIPPKPKPFEIPSIVRPLVAISYMWILEYNWERYFNLVDLIRLDTDLTSPITGNVQHVNNTYAVFEYKGGIAYRN